MTAALVRPTGAIAWELRAAWARGRRVALSLDGLPRVEGLVKAVSPTGASVTVGRLHVPLDRVLAVHRPSLLGDSTARGGGFDGSRPRVLDVAAGQQTFAYATQPEEDTHG